MHPFLPKIIYVDPTVSTLPLTRRVLSYFEGIPIQMIENPESLKVHQPMETAKETLLITRQKGETFKSCQGMGDYVCCNYLTLSFVSNCHFECTRYHPIFCFNHLGDLERALLRNGNVASADDWRSVLEPVVATEDPNSALV